MNTNKIKAWTITVAIHVVLIVVLLLVKYQLPAQPIFQDELLEVDLGTSDDGFGTDQPEYMDGPAPAQTATSSEASSTQSSTQDDNSSIDDHKAPDAVSINRPSSPTPNNRINNTNPKRNTTNNTTTNTATTRNNNSTNNNASTTTSTPRARYTYEGGQGQGGNSATRNNPGGSQGDGSGSGDKGVPGGVVGGAYVSAVPNLKGRSLRTRPDPKATFNEGGTVVVRVTVDKSGKIIRHSIVRASNATIQNIVLQKLRQVTFTESKDAPPEQSGTITFTFKTSKG